MLPKNKPLNISEELLNQEAVILSQGKNLFGEPIFAYIKFPMTNFYKLREAMTRGENFKPSDYGEVLVSGRGEPSIQLKEEMKVKYGIASGQGSIVSKNKKNEKPTLDFSDEKPMDGLNKELSIEIQKIGIEINEIR